MAQRYADPAARARMRNGLCPECGKYPEQHSDDPRFWVPRNCDLLPQGVRDRIEQYEIEESDPGHE